MKNKFSPINYIKISYDALLIYSLYELQKNNRHTTFENLVAECFVLFPKRFQLPGYPVWPDSSQVERSWLRCRTDKGLIYGSKSKGFTLTTKGLVLAKSVFQKLQGGAIENNTKGIQGDARTRSGRLVKRIESSKAFLKFIRDKNLNNISDFEFCDLIYSTLDTDPSLRRRSLEELKYHTGVYEREDLLSFLDNCEEKFRHLLRDPNMDSYEGGMMKKRKK